MITILFMSIITSKTRNSKKYIHLNTREIVIYIHKEKKSNNYYLTCDYQHYRSQLTNPVTFLGHHLSPFLWADWSLRKPSHDLRTYVRLINIGIFWSCQVKEKSLRHSLNVSVSFFCCEKRKCWWTLNDYQEIFAYSANCQQCCLLSDSCIFMKRGCI